MGIEGCVRVVVCTKVPVAVGDRSCRGTAGQSPSVAASEPIRPHGGRHDHEPPPSSGGPREADEDHYDFQIETQR